MACWLGALLSPGENQLGPVARFASISALIGVLVGGWLGALVGILPLGEGLRMEFQGMVIAACLGALAGVGAAIAVRLLRKG